MVASPIGSVLSDSVDVSAPPTKFIDIDTSEDGQCLHIVRSFGSRPVVSNQTLPTLQCWEELLVLLSYNLNFRPFQPPPCASKQPFRGLGGTSTARDPLGQRFSLFLGGFLRTCPHPPCFFSLDGTYQVARMFDWMSCPSSENRTGVVALHANCSLWDSSTQMTQMLTIWWLWGPASLFSL